MSIIKSKTKDGGISSVQKIKFFYIKELHDLWLDTGSKIKNEWQLEGTFWGQWEKIEYWTVY